ncbi:hypothetical protein BIFBRE_05118, partial [Bifidobacterium breve DSM 20213 = JCM 1192]
RLEICMWKEVNYTSSHTILIIELLKSLVEQLTTKFIENIA